MFSRSAQHYDLIYSAFKDYKTESAKVAKLISEQLPTAKTILDVACGTGEHAKFLSTIYGYQVDGIDLDNKLLAIARSKLPESNFYQADMSNFKLGTKYDVTICLFSSIGYVQTFDKLVLTIKNFKEHTISGGLIVVEPWFSPSNWEAGQLHMKTVESDDFKVCRMSSSKREESLSKLHFEYLIGAEDEIFHETEEHVLGLFTEEQMKNAFDEAGLKAEFDPTGIFGRGLYTAEKT